MRIIYYFLWKGIRTSFYFFEVPFFLNSISLAKNKRKRICQEALSYLISLPKNCIYIFFFMLEKSCDLTIESLEKCVILILTFYIWPLKMNSFHFLIFHVVADINAYCSWCRRCLYSSPNRCYFWTFWGKL